MLVDPLQFGFRGIEDFLVVPSPDMSHMVIPRKRRFVECVGFVEVSSNTATQRSDERHGRNEQFMAFML